MSARETGLIFGVLAVLAWVPMLLLLWPTPGGYVHVTPTPISVECTPPDPCLIPPVSVAP